MRIYAHNPRLVAGVRGRTSTVLVLRDRDGARVEMVYTSLPALEALVSDIQDAIATLAPDGTVYARWPEATPAETTQSQATGHILWEMGLLHSPGSDPRPVPHEKVGARAGTKPNARPRVSRRDYPLDPPER